MFSQALVKFFCFLPSFDGRPKLWGGIEGWEKDPEKAYKITQLWRNFIFSYVSLFSHSFYQKYIMMKFKWQLNFDTIHIMRSGENRRMRNGKQNMICMCVVLLTCVNFNELAFIIYHVSLKHPFFESPRKKKPHIFFLSCCVSLANCDPPEIVWRDKIALNLLKAKSAPLGMWDYFTAFAFSGDTKTLSQRNRHHVWLFQLSNRVINFHLIS